jgi:hypothetical protein
MTKPTIEMIITGDGLLVISYQRQPEAPDAVLAFTTGGVDEHIQHLGLTRAGMVPSISSIWERGQRVDCYRNPVTVVEADQLARDAILHLRDERFGWLHFIFSKDEARKLGAALIAQADRPSPPAAGRA